MGLSQGGFPIGIPLVCPGSVRGHNYYLDPDSRNVIVFSGAPPSVYPVSCFATCFVRFAGAFTPRSSQDFITRGGDLQLK